MLGYIILRDIPKKAAQLDLSVYEVKGGFRGFALVPPGLHYVSIEVKEQMIEGFWCYLRPNDAVIKVFDYENEIFTDPDCESEERYKIMALSGAMNHALIPVMQRTPRMTNKWQKLVSHIKEDNFPLKLNHETPMQPPLDLSAEELSKYYLEKHKSRFELAFIETHKADVDSFLAEIQLAFVQAFVQENTMAKERWQHLILSIYNVGERSIKDHEDLFPPLVDLIINQFDCLPDLRFSPQDILIDGSSNLIEDMNDTGLEKLIEKAQILNDYLNKRRVNYFKCRLART
jgi:hypothetical protein